MERKIRAEIKEMEKKIQKKKEQRGGCLES
jgi:hypothetical protein